MLKKIRLTIFYTDEEIYNIVRKSGVNTKMVSWANEFYKRYNYELDIFPIPYSKNQYEELFILKEKDGTIIPFQFLEEINIMQEKSDVLTKEIDKLNRERRITDVPATKKMNIQRIMNEFRNQLGDSYLKVRVECHNKFRDDFPDKKPARLVVVYCRSELPQLSISGATIHNESNWLPFILIPVVSGKDDFTVLQTLLSKAYSTLAHEIIHATGHHHPPRGGNYDGPDNSIMNFASDDRLPANVILERKHLALLDTAYFTT